MPGLEVCVIGGGISGLHTAYQLANRGVSFKLLEARNRLGGRIYSTSSIANTQLDLGPSWFWPGQSHILNLVHELELENRVFEQYSQGDGIYEAADGAVHKGYGGFSMAGSYRLRGGLGLLLDAMREKILSASGVDTFEIAAPVEQITLEDNSIQVSSTKGQVECEHVVLAVPPRVAIQEISFSPMLAPERVGQLREVSTWMAGHAKTVIVFEAPFWRSRGLSGDVISQLGPLSEVHDASNDAANVFALFGFFATPPSQRVNNIETITEDIRRQLTRVFGADMPNPTQVIYQDWATEPFTATALDQHIPNHHPTNHLPNRLEPNWNNRLVWSGAESDSGRFNGYIEGALSASVEALKMLSKY